MRLKNQSPLCQPEFFLGGGGLEGITILQLIINEVLNCFLLSPNLCLEQVGITKKCTEEYENLKNSDIIMRMAK